jgi:hypothetical protein
VDRRFVGQRILHVSGVITRGSKFATDRDRTSGADPGGSDRSSGTDPLLTRHPAPRETGRDFRPIRSASETSSRLRWRSERARGGEGRLLRERRAECAV